MNKVTVIIPINEFNDTVKKYLSTAILSIKEQIENIPNLLVVYTSRAEESGLLTYLSEFSDLNISTVKNEGKSDFCSQINVGAKNAQTEYFSILEYDDKYSRIYFKNVEKYINELSDVSLFLQLTIDVDDKSGSPIQLVNQNIWSNAYVGENGELGYINNKALSEYSYYTIGGAVFRKKDFESVGGLKSNIQLAFTYEFLLRFLNNGNKIYVIPKFGYIHSINREGSLFTGLSGTLSIEDRKFWFETAVKESHYLNDREIVKN
jgi:hypothetical protein